MSKKGFEGFSLLRSRVGYALAALAFASLPSVVGGRSYVEATDEQTFPLSANATVTIRNTDGRIYVYGSNKNELTIIAWKRAFTEERLQGIKVNAVVDANSAVIDTIYPPPPEGRFDDRSGTVDYTIIVPESCTLAKAELANGEIMLQDLRGESATATAEKGRIHVRNCFTDVRVAVGSGGMDVFYMWWEQGAFSLLAEIGSGNLRLALPPNAAAAIDVVSVHGSIRNRLPKQQQQGNNRALQTTIGEETSAESSAELKARATRGNITIERSY